ncbi:MAG TPA: glycosyltransferase family 2 protein [Kofleriaceae bacterium]|nr:glycosyltransferase family 2 protein [Kofleriaceae bacterium]
MVDLIIAAQNDASTLRAVLAAVPARHLRSIVVVDNDSRDGTGQMAIDAGAIVLREGRVGYGAACKRAVLHLEALPRPPDVVVFMAADGSDDPADIPSLLLPVRRDNAELVIGVRQREGRPVRQGRSRVALGLISAIYRHRFEDIGPFRAVGFPALVALGMRDAGAGWNVEMLVKAVNFGLHIVEVPVASRGEPGPTRGAGMEDLIDSVGATGRVLFRILRNATAR